MILSNVIMGPLPNFQTHHFCALIDAENDEKFF